ncbi:MAG TPA: hypothetical protein VHO47_03110 [Candidatus Babeliales bacterium]|nr:hypothetical protein [Candidatus Babeliales bacterium]
MKKLVLAALAVAALFAFEADARYGCNTCPKKRCCAERVVEEACPQAPCCVRYVRVEEPAQRTKHVSYSWECPSDCATEAPKLMVGQTYEQ